MSLFFVTAPTVEPVSLADAKLHVRVDTPDEDILIQSLIRAAREYVETATHRALLTQTWDLKLDGFPSAEGAICVPMPPVSSVTSITYTATDGTATTWSSSLYTTDLPTGPHAAPARITPAYGQYYPLTRDVMNAVTVRVVCGYGTTAATVPDSLRSAVKLLVGHWYASREAGQMGAMVTPMLLALDALIWPYKVF